WTAVSGATSYDVYRATQVPGYSFVASPTTNSYNDSPVSAGQTYVYIVRAVTNDGTSGFSDPDAATTILFTDPTLNSSVLVKAIHLAEIRQAVNAMRAAAGLVAATFSPATAGTIIQRAHIVEARDALDEARTAIGLPGIGYTDPIITAGATTVKAAHFTGLRQGTQ
ncbi:MAG TPA: hypothetical protein VM779_13570, partial [Thermoanaerobaculia bacterium]|nr:hypothetical protein [Thermoanaerobaculia bacterium]